ncbi:hypothetical protein E2C01_020453 [Portunus trituberculatus]|uniref:Uncharacterized protein n=1 Tax=Portunus trituberculatus TaxID=210409 RepID=A0A5B7E1I6_PORTR|nr:hypothetical protein [Portunus trituberculatus]
MKRAYMWGRQGVLTSAGRTGVLGDDQKVSRRTQESHETVLEVSTAAGVVNILADDAAHVCYGSG